MSTNLTGVFWTRDTLSAILLIDLAGVRLKSTTKVANIVPSAYEIVVDGYFKIDVELPYRERIEDNRVLHDLLEIKSRTGYFS